MRTSSIAKVLLPLAGLVTLTACGGSDDSAEAPAAETTPGAEEVIAADADGDQMVRTTEDPAAVPVELPDTGAPGTIEDSAAPAEEAPAQ